LPCPAWAVFLTYNNPFCTFFCALSGENCRETERGLLWHTNLQFGAYIFDPGFNSGVVGR
jgi:hypothetical protein